MNESTDRKRDIFIDNNIAKKIASAKDFEYIKLIVWLMQLSKSDVDKIFPRMRIANKEILYSCYRKENRPYLAISRKILNEYSSSSNGAKSITAITNVINRLKADGNRLNSIKKSQIDEFIEKRKKSFLVWTI